ncbi:MAG TPA: TolC family protein [Phycisphaerae bacterium]|nr:TolC family protein [Phycisphaerae bacterium]HNU46771.1 TolC family protein [Phycisphaerae bacterium]
MTASQPTSWPRRTCGTAALLIVVVTTGTACRPRPGLDQMRRMNAVLDMEVCHARAPVPDTPLSLDDALAYAAQYNIEAWLAAQESRLQHELATQATLKMLPSLLAGAAYRERNRYDASSSQSFATGEESLEPSFSTEKRGRTFDVSATWNLLDFGLSYLRARQQTDREWIARQRERRVQQDLAFQVTRAYWQTVTAAESAGQAEEISAQVAARLARVRQEMEDKVISPVDGLGKETALLQQQDELRRYQRDYLKARTELAKLMGLPPGTPVVLASLDLDASVEARPYDVEALEWTALRRRPELFEKDLEHAISRDEAHVALAQMLPSPAALFQYNYDSNRFLVFNDWNTVGIRASWDLLAIPHQLQQRRATKLQAELTVTRRVALAVAILAQLHLALIDYQEAMAQCAINQTIADRHRLLLEAVRTQAEEGKSHEGEVVDQQVKCLRARARYLSARADLMTAEARLLNTIGLDPPWNDALENEDVMRPALEPDISASTADDATGE